MTPEVAALVLRNNYLQSQAHQHARAAGRPRACRSTSTSSVCWSAAGDLNRALEFLPTDEELTERRKRGVGLTRPELAILLAYSKIWLNAPPARCPTCRRTRTCRASWRATSRKPMQERFPRAIGHHRLRREIIATATTNSLVNRMGPTFVRRAQEDTGADPAQIARAYTAAREIFAMREVWEQIEALDNKVPAQLQYEAAFQTSRLLRHATYWLLAKRTRAGSRRRGGGVPRRRAAVWRRRSTRRSPARSCCASRRVAGASPRAACRRRSRCTSRASRR